MMIIGQKCTGHWANLCGQNYNTLFVEKLQQMLNLAKERITQTKFEASL